MKTTLKTVLTREFQEALQKLKSHPDMKASLAWKILPSYKRLKEAYKDYDNVRLELCEQYGQRDEQDNLIKIPVNDSGAYSYAFNPQDELMFNSQLEDLRNQELSLPEPKVSVSEVFDLNLTVENLDALVGLVLKED